MINIIINVSPSLLSTFWHPPELEKIVPSKAPIYRVLCYTQGFPGGSTVKHLPATTRDKGSIPESRRSPRVGNSNPRQYSCLENSVDGEGWQAEVHRVARSQTWLSAAQHNFLSTTFSEWIITPLKWGGSYCFWHRMRMHWIYETWSCKQSTHMEEQGWAREGGSDKLSLSFCALSAACGLPCPCLWFFCVCVFFFFLVYHFPMSEDQEWLFLRPWVYILL